MEVLDRVDHERIRAACDADDFFWLDLVDPGEDDVLALGDLLTLHPLQLNDTKNFEQRPKVDEMGPHVFVVFFSVIEAPDEERRWRPLEVHVYISGSWLVTVRRAPSPALEGLHHELSELPPEAEVDAVYRVFRALCDQVDPAIDELDARLDVRERDVFEQVQHARLADLYHLRQELGDLQRRLAGTRDSWPSAENAILALPGLTQDRKIELSDIRDQLVELAGDLTRQHDDASTLVSLYFSANGDRINRQAARLTVLATFFVVWTLVTGFFGQNFGWLTRHIDSFAAFAIYEGLGLLVPTIVLGVYFWRKRADLF